MLKKIIVAILLLFSDNLVLPQNQQQQIQTQQKQLQKNKKKQAETKPVDEQKNDTTDTATVNEDPKEVEEITITHKQHFYICAACGNSNCSSYQEVIDHCYYYGCACSECKGAAPGNGNDNNEMVIINSGTTSRDNIRARLRGEK